MPTLLAPKPAPVASKTDDAVRATLADTGRKIRVNDALTGGLVVAAVALAYAVAVVLLDRWLALPAWSRQLGLLALLASAGALGWFLVVLPLRRTVNPRYVARQVEGTIADPKNAVINWVDLQDREIPGSVRSALSQKAAAGLAESDPTNAVASSRMAWAGGVVAILIGVLAVLFLLFKAQFLSLLGRAFNPFTDRAIVTRTTIELVNPTGDMTVTDGEQIGFIVRVMGKIPEFGGPQQVRLKVRYAADTEVFDEYPLDRGETIRDYSLTAGRLVIQNGFWYRVAAGDAETPEYRVTVRTRPMIQKWQTQYEYPEYLRLKPDSGKANEPRIDGFRGTNVTLTVTTNRTVKAGTMTTDIAGQESSIPGEVVGDAKDSLRFKLTLQDKGTYTLRFTSTDDEDSGATVPYPIDVYVDQPPTIAILKPEQEEIVLPTNGLLAVDALIGDDHGIATATLKFKLADGTAIAPKPFRDGKSFKRDTDGSFPTSLDYKDSVKLDTLKGTDGKAVELKPDTVLEYWLEAADNCTVPAANVGKSKVQRVRLTQPETEPMKKAEQQKQQEQKQEQRKGEEQQNNQKQDQKNQTEKREPEQPQNREKDPQQQQGEQGEKDPMGQQQPGGKGEQNPDKQPNPMGGNPDKANPDKANPKPMGEPNPEQQPNPADQDLQKKAEDLQNKIDEQQKQPGQGKPDPNQQKPDMPEQKPAEGKPGEKNGAGQEGASEAKPEPKPNEMDPKDPNANPGEGKGAGDVKQPEKAEAKPEPKPGEDPNGGDPKDQPKDGPKPDDQKGAGEEKKGQPQQQPKEPGAKPEDTDAAGGKGSGEPKPDPMNPQPQPKPGEKKGGPESAGQAKPSGDVNRGEQKPQPKPGEQGANPNEQPKPGEDPKPDPEQKGGAGKGKEPPKKAEAKPGTPDGQPMGAKPEPAEGKEPPKEQGGQPMAQEDKPGEGKGAGAQQDPKDKPVAKGEQKPTAQQEKGGEPGEGGKPDAAKQKEIEDAVKDLASNDKAKQDAARDKLDKEVGPEARKKAEDIVNDMKSGDPKRQEDAKKKLDEMAKQMGKDGQKNPGGNGDKPKELTPEQKKELTDAAKDLNSPDPAKREAAEKKLEDKIGKGEREKLQKDLKDLNDAAKNLNNPDDAKRKEAEKKLDEQIGKGEREKLQQEQKAALEKLDRAKQKELADAAKDLASDDKKKQDAAREKLDKEIGKDAREKMEQMAKDLKSDDKDKRDAAKRELDELAKKAEKEQPPLSDEEKKRREQAAQDLNSPDDAKRKAAEEMLDEKIGKDRREEVQKQMKELNDQIADAKRGDRPWQPGGNPPKGPDGKPLEDNPENRLKSAELQLKTFKEYKDDPNFLKKANMTEKEMAEFLKGYEEMVARQRAEVDRAKAADPRTPGPDLRGNFSDGSGANERLTGPKVVPGGPSTGGAAVAPPGFSDAHRRFIEEALKRQPK